MCKASQDTCRNKIKCMIAVANRVPFEDKLDVRRVTYEAATKSLTAFVPDKKENNLLREDFKHLVSNVLKKYIPSLQWLDKHVSTHKYHSYKGYTKKKSQIVSI